MGKHPPPQPRVLDCVKVVQAAEAIDAFIMPHQREAGAFIRQREAAGARFARGGFIWDDMGAGKTISMLAPVVAEVAGALADRTPIPKTLIIASNTCWKNWEDEWKRLCATCGIACPIVHITRSLTEAVMAAGHVFMATPSFIGMMWVRMATTFPTDVRFRPTKKTLKALADAAAADPEDGGPPSRTARSGDRVFFASHFSRIIADEVDFMRNDDQTNLYCGIRAIHADVRWGLTGTPIHRGVANVTALLRYIGVSREDIKRYPIQTIVGAVAIRRTAQQLAVQNIARTLPNMDIYGTFVPFSRPEEKFLYQILANEAYHSASANIEASNKRGIGDTERTPGRPRAANNFTNRMMRMRAASFAPSLVARADDEPSVHILEALLQAHGASFTAADVMTAPWAGTESSKMRAIVAYTKEHAGRGILIFLEWTRGLEILREALLRHGGFKEEEIAYYHGKLTPEKKAQVYEYMASDPRCRVGLISLTAGNYSLNLPRFKVVAFGMASFDPQVEHQAMCRAWRQGQTETVTVMYFISPGYDEAIRKQAEERYATAQVILNAATSSADAHPRGAGPKQMCQEDFCALFGTYGRGEFDKDTPETVKFATVTADGGHVAPSGSTAAWIEQALGNEQRRVARADNTLTAERLATAITELPSGPNAAALPLRAQAFASRISVFVAGGACTEVPCAHALAGSSVLVSKSCGRVARAEGASAIDRAAAVARVVSRAPRLQSWASASAFQAAAAKAPGMAEHGSHFLGGGRQFVLKITPLLAELAAADGFYFADEDAYCLFRPADHLVDSLQ